MQVRRMMLRLHVLGAHCPRDAAPIAQIVAAQLADSRLAAGAVFAMVGDAFGLAVQQAHPASPAARMARSWAAVISSAWTAPFACGHATNAPGAASRHCHGSGPRTVATASMTSGPMASSGGGTPRPGCQVPPETTRPL